MTSFSTSESAPERSEKARGPSQAFVTSLDELVGAHPAALRALFEGGQAADPRDLGEAPQGRLLAIEPAREVNGIARPIVQALAGPLPWRGKVLRSDGTGANVVSVPGRRLSRGLEVAPFSWRVEPSAIDGAPALLLSYAERPWPLRAVHDELRAVSDGVAIGPIVVDAPRGPVVIGWFGLSRALG